MSQEQTPGGGLSLADRALLRRATTPTRPDRKRAPLVEPLEARQMLDGAIDTTFGVGGSIKVAFDLGGNKSDDAQAVAIQRDGKIVVVGSARVGDTDSDFAVTRLNVDGTIDPSFGKRTVAFDLGGDNADSAQAVAIQADGKILIAGGADRANGNSDFAIARLNADGTLDPGFGAGGKATVAFDLGASKIDQVRAIALQADGKIVLAGYVQHPIRGNGPQGDFGIARLNADGTLDTSFHQGKIVVDFGNDSFDTVGGLAIQPDGKILVGGLTREQSVLADSMALIRLTTSGDLDPTFGVQGKVRVDPTGDFDNKIEALALRPDGRIVAVGILGDVNNTGAAGVVQFTASGSLDPGFGGSGKVVLGAGSAHAVAIQADGKVLVAGSVDLGQSSDSAVVRLTAGGVPDGTFGTSGLVAANLGDYDEFQGVAIQSDGKIVAVGSSGISSNNDMTVARFVGVPPLATLPIPSSPTLDPGSDTGTRGDSRTKATRPKLTGTTLPGYLVELLDGLGHVLGSATADGTGAYAILPTAPLAAGTYQLSARVRDASGRAGTASAALALTILPAGVSPTLIVAIHGQQVDGNALAAGAAAAFGAAFPLIPAALLTYDVANGIPVTGTGRALDQWQVDIGPLAFKQIAAAIGDQATAVKTLEVAWDTYGTEGGPAQETAARVNQIVADTSYDGEPWDVLFVGFSRGGPFVNQVIKNLDLRNNARIDYSEAILLDPTASKVSGDVFPEAMPAGLDRAIQYDDGYAFPVTQLGFKLGGLRLDYPLLTVDGNSGGRYAGADYRYVRDRIQAYLQQTNGVDPLDSAAAHAAVPYWWLYNTPGRSAPGQVTTDIAEFLANKDHGAAGASGKAIVDLGSEIFRPTSTAANLKDPINDIAAQLKRLGEALLNSAKQFADYLVQQAKALANAVADQAKKLGAALLASARNQGAAVLAAARAQQAKLFKAATAEVNRLNAQAKAEADRLLKQGQLFGQGAAKAVQQASSNLAAVQKKSSAAVAQAQKSANQAVAAVAKAVGAAKAKAEAAARQAAAKLAQARAKAEEAARQAAAKVAAAAAKAQAAAQAAAQRAADAANQAANKISSGYQKARKKFHL